MDQVWEAIPHTVEPYSFTHSRLFGDLTYNVFKNTSVRVGYSLYGVRRQEGTHETEKNKTEDGTFKVSVDSNPMDWLALRVTYLNSKRTWSLDHTWYAS